METEPNIAANPGSVKPLTPPAPTTYPDAVVAGASFKVRSDLQFIRKCAQGCAIARRNGYPTSANQRMFLALGFAA